MTSAHVGAGGDEIADGLIDAVDGRGGPASARGRKSRPTHHRQHREALPGCRHVAVRYDCVRVLQFHADLDEFYPVYQVWERRLGGRPLPFSAVEVPAPLPVPGATVMIEVWAYAL